ncbi:hypothetical protein ACH4K8_34970 [Streptomyces anulatus]
MPTKKIEARAEAAHTLREEQSGTPRTGRDVQAQPVITSSPTTARPLSPRVVTGWVLRRPETLPEIEYLGTVVFNDESPAAGELDDDVDKPMRRPGERVAPGTTRCRPRHP